jgi:metal-responsive CopG/Arc/MetJ family transcriptional regulator
MGATTGVKHNISLTIDSKLFREIENIRGREKRSTFMEHLIVLGLKTYRNKNEEIFTVKDRKAPITFLPPMNFSKTQLE